MKTPLIALAATLMTAAPVWADVPPEPPVVAVAADDEPECTEHSITIYFADEQIGVSSVARNALEATIDMIDSCAVTQIRTTALSADASSRSEMMLLSEARTDSVLESVAAAGIWAPSVQTDIIAHRDPNRPDTASEPMARRVEVRLLTVPAITS